MRSQAARANAFKIDWSAYTPPKPAVTGTRVFAEYPLHELVERIDWTPFFRAWELAGNYPAILEDKVVGESARKLYADARKMLDHIVREKWLTAKGVVSFWPCRRDGDDVVLFEDDTRTKEISRLYFLRQQIEKRAPRANMCLADFISPEADWIGGFAVTAGHGIEQHLARFKADHDDYSDILLKALADRLAEAFAERLHERVRKTLWGYAPDEALTNDELMREKYRGIRPAPGYPACPDHSQKPELFRLLNAGQNAGISLTESFAMMPTSAVSGYYFAHPEAAVFRRRPHRPRPGRGLCQASRLLDRAGGEVAEAEHRVLVERGPPGPLMSMSGPGGPRSDELRPRPGRRLRRRHGERHRRHRRHRHPAARAGHRLRAARGGADHGDRRPDVELRQDHLVVARDRLEGAAAPTRWAAFRRRRWARAPCSSCRRTPSRWRSACSSSPWCPGRRWLASRNMTIGLGGLVIAGAVIGFLTGIVVSTGPLSVPTFAAYGLVKGAFIATEAAGSLALYISKALTFRQFGALPDRHRRQGPDLRLVGHGRHLPRPPDRRAAERGRLPVHAGHRDGGLRPCPFVAGTALIDLPYWPSREEAG